MLRFYWPRKPIPTWLQKITFSGTSNGNIPKAYHNGFGFIVRRGGIFHAYGLTGYFVWVDAAGMSLTVEGQAGGVYYHDAKLFLKKYIWGKQE